MSSISVITSCRLPGRFSSEGWYFLGIEAKRATSGFGLIVMLGGYLFFISLYIAGILWNYIQASLWSLWLTLLLLNIDDWFHPKMSTFLRALPCKGTTEWARQFLNVRFNFFKLNTPVQNLLFGFLTVVFVI